MLAFLEKSAGLSLNEPGPYGFCRGKTGDGQPGCLGEIQPDALHLVSPAPLRAPRCSSIFPIEPEKY